MTVTKQPFLPTIYEWIMREALLTGIVIGTMLLCLIRTNGKVSGFPSTKTQKDDDSDAKVNKEEGSQRSILPPTSLMNMVFDIWKDIEDPDTTETKDPTESEHDTDESATYVPDPDEENDSSNVDSDPLNEPQPDIEEDEDEDNLSDDMNEFESDNHLLSGSASEMLSPENREQLDIGRDKRPIVAANINPIIASPRMKSTISELTSTKRVKSTAKMDKNLLTHHTVVTKPHVSHPAKSSDHKLLHSVGRTNTTPKYLRISTTTESENKKKYTLKPPNVTKHSKSVQKYPVTHHGDTKDKNTKKCHGVKTTLVPTIKSSSCGTFRNTASRGPLRFILFSKALKHHTTRSSLAHSTLKTTTWSELSSVSQGPIASVSEGSLNCARGKIPTNIQTLTSNFQPQGKLQPSSRMVGQLNVTKSWNSLLSTSFAQVPQYIPRPFSHDEIHWVSTKKQQLFVDEFPNNDGRLENKKGPLHSNLVANVEHEEKVMSSTTPSQKDHVEYSVPLATEGKQNTPSQQDHVEIGSLTTEGKQNTPSQQDHVEIGSLTTEGKQNTPSQQDHVEFSGPLATEGKQNTPLKKDHVELSVPLATEGKQNTPLQQDHVEYRVPLATEGKQNTPLQKDHVEYSAAAATEGKQNTPLQKDHVEYKVPLATVGKQITPLKFYHLGYSVPLATEGKKITPLQKYHVGYSVPMATEGKQNTPLQQYHVEYKVPLATEGKKNTPLKHVEYSVPLAIERKQSTVTSSHISQIHNLWEENSTFNLMSFIMKVNVTPSVNRIQDSYAIPALNVPSGMNMVMPPTAIGLGTTENNPSIRTEISQSYGYNIPAYSVKYTDVLEHKGVNYASTPYALVVNAKSKPDVKGVLNQFIYPINEMTTTPIVNYSPENYSDGGTTMFISDIYNPLYLTSLPLELAPNAFNLNNATDEGAAFSTGFQDSTSIILYQTEQSAVNKNMSFPLRNNGKLFVENLNNGALVNPVLNDISDNVPWKTELQRSFETSYAANMTFLQPFVTELQQGFDLTEVFPTSSIGLYSQETQYALSKAGFRSNTEFSEVPSQSDFRMDTPVSEIPTEENLFDSFDLANSYTLTNNELRKLRNIADNHKSNISLWGVVITASAAKNPASLINQSNFHEERLSEYPRNNYEQQALSSSIHDSKLNPQEPLVAKYSESSFSFPSPMVIEKSDVPNTQSSSSIIERRELLSEDFPMTKRPVDALKPELQSTNSIKRIDTREISEASKQEINIITSESLEKKLEPVLSQYLPLKNSSENRRSVILPTVVDSLPDMSEMGITNVKNVDAIPSLVEYGNSSHYTSLKTLSDTSASSLKIGQDESSETIARSPAAVTGG